jgi:hypothetical protein
MSPKCHASGFVPPLESKERLRAFQKTEIGWGIPIETSVSQGVLDCAAHNHLLPTFLPDPLLPPPSPIDNFTHKQLGLSSGNGVLSASSLSRRRQDTTQTTTPTTKTLHSNSFTAHRCESRFLETPRFKPVALTSNHSFDVLHVVHHGSPVDMASSTPIVYCFGGKSASTQLPGLSIVRGIGDPPASSTVRACAGDIEFSP